MGEVFRPNWRKFKPGKTVSATVADYLAFNCIATMDDGASSHFLDMRGEARRVVRGREEASRVDGGAAVVQGRRRATARRRFAHP